MDLACSTIEASVAHWCKNVTVGRTVYSRVDATLKFNVVKLLANTVTFVSPNCKNTKQTDASRVAYWRCCQGFSDQDIWALFRHPKL